VTLGEKLSDLVSKQLGTWKFISILSTITAFWIGWNVYAPKNKKFDPFPFIALNLTYSFLSAYTAPILLMSSSRASEADRKRSVENLTLIVRITLVSTPCYKKLKQWRNRYLKLCSTKKMLVGVSLVLFVRIVVPSLVFGTTLMANTLVHRPISRHIRRQRARCVAK